MKKRSNLSLEAALMIAAMALASMALFAAPHTARASEEVTISGQLLADDSPMNDAILVVELGNDVCLRSELKASGRFEFKVPVGAKARLIFLKPRYLTKEVVVDTRNAMTSDDACRLNKKVKFDVVLEEELQHRYETHPGPVGFITFVNGSGLMRVRHDERMVPVVRSEDMEGTAKQ